MSDDMNDTHELHGPRDWMNEDQRLMRAVRDAEPQLATFLDSVRSEYLSTSPRTRPELAMLISAGGREYRILSRTRGWRSSLVARAAAVAAAAMAATGGLAIAHALPAPLQDTVSSLGIGRPAAPHEPVAGHAPTVPASTRVDGRALPHDVSSTAPKPRRGLPGIIPAPSRRPARSGPGPSGSAGRNPADQSTATTGSTTTTDTTTVTTSTTVPKPTGKGNGNANGSGNANPNGSGNPNANANANANANGKRQNASK
jgi:hypothetical protein